MGQRHNMNGAGAGGRLVAKRTKTGVKAGKSQLGSREQKRNDLRVALGGAV